MLYWALVFSIVAALAALFGFGGAVPASLAVAKFLFFLFFIGSLISVVMHIRRRV